MKSLFSLPRTGRSFCRLFPTTSSSIPCMYSRPTSLVKVIASSPRLFSSSPFPFSSSSSSSPPSSPTSPLTLQHEFPSVKDMMLPEDYAAYQHAQEATEFWKKFCIFVVAPSLVLLAAYCVNREMNHMSHIEPREYKPYTYMRKRRSVYPWGDGDKSLFHSELNPCPPPEEE